MTTTRKYGFKRGDAAQPTASALSTLLFVLDVKAKARKDLQSVNEILRDFARIDPRQLSQANINVLVEQALTTANKWQEFVQTITRK
jgi:hypothetical protein